MEEASYSQWARQLIRDCSESKRRAVKHEIYKRMRDKHLEPQSNAHVSQGLAGSFHSFRCITGHNLGKTRYGRHPGEDMARRWLIRTSGSSDHADYWVNWALVHYQP